MAIPCPWASPSKKGMGEGCVAMLAKLWFSSSSRNTCRDCGNCTVTVAEPLWLESAFDTALMVTVAVAGELAVGTLAGAVYMPLASIVPVVALPPATPFTCQVTLLLLALAAWNCCVLPTTTALLEGVTVTDVPCGGLFEPDELEPPPPQPVTTIASRKRNTAGT